MGFTRRAVLSGMACLLASPGLAMEADRPWIIDALREPGVSELGTRWSGVTDGVMGGVSRLEVELAQIDNEVCYRMTGQVRTENNGGFIQMALPLADGWGALDLSDYAGVRLRVRGNGEAYAVHLRTTANRVPWDYYRAEFETEETWRDIELRFEDFSRSRGRGALDRSSIQRLAVVGAGRDFAADVSISRVELFR